MKDFAYHVSLPLHLLDKLMFIKLKLNTILFVVSDDIGTPFGGQWQRLHHEGSGDDEQRKWFDSFAYNPWFFEDTCRGGGRS